MADFTSGFWNFYVMAIVTCSIIFCAVILALNNKRNSGPVQLHGHVWDESLVEYNNPLPRWWMYLFWITIIFSVAYLALFPGFGSFKGVLGWTSIGQYEREVRAVNESLDPLFSKYRNMDIQAMAADRDARATGRRLFLTYCSQCHGSDARGARGFPNLTNKSWHWGGAPETIQTTITNGRLGVMTPFKEALSAAQIDDLANYVRSLSGLSADAAAVARAKPLFETNCQVCHGPDGKGNPDLGAPNLTDDEWLWGSSKEAIVFQIANGRMNRMPGFGDFLGEDKVRLLAAYVWGLSNVPQ